MLFFITFMLPKFMAIFEGFNVELPLPTRILITVSYIFTHLWWLMLLLLVAAVIMFKRFQATERASGSWTSGR